MSDIDYIIIEEGYYRITNDDLKKMINEYDKLKSEKEKCIKFLCKQSENMGKLIAKNTEFYQKWKKAEEDCKRMSDQLETVIEQRSTKQQRLVKATRKLHDIRTLLDLKKTSSIGFLSPTEVNIQLILDRED